MNSKLKIIQNRLLAGHKYGKGPSDRVSKFSSKFTKSAYLKGALDSQLNITGDKKQLLKLINRFNSKKRFTNLNQVFNHELKTNRRRHSSVANEGQKYQRLNKTEGSVPIDIDEEPDIVQEVIANYQNAVLNNLKKSEDIFRIKGTHKLTAKEIQVEIRRKEYFFF